MLLWLLYMLGLQQKLLFLHRHHHTLHCWYIITYITLDVNICSCNTLVWLRWRIWTIISTHMKWYFFYSVKIWKYKFGYIVNNTMYLLFKSQSFNNKAGLWPTSSSSSLPLHVNVCYNTINYHYVQLCLRLDFGKLTKLSHIGKDCTWVLHEWLLSAGTIKWP